MQKIIVSFVVNFAIVVAATRFVTIYPLVGAVVIALFLVAMFPIMAYIGMPE